MDVVLILSNRKAGCVVCVHEAQIRIYGEWLAWMCVCGWRRGDKEGNTEE